MTKYKVILLGTLQNPKEEVMFIESDNIGFKGESIVFADNGETPKLIVPQNCSIVIKLEENDTNP